MRFRLILVAAIAVLSSLLLTPSANAAAETPPTPFSKYFPAGFGSCTNEPGTFAGTVNFTTFESGGVLVSRANYANTTYTTDSGTIYRVTQVFGTTITSVEGSQRTFETSLTFNFVGADGQFQRHRIILIVTIDPDDPNAVPIVSFDRTTSDGCG